jgi:hypothetical protein
MILHLPLAFCTDYVNTINNFNLMISSRVFCCFAANALYSIHRAILIQPYNYTIPMPPSIYFTTGPFVAPAGGACAGASGTLTSSKSSCETALMVKASGGSISWLHPSRRPSPLLTDTNTESKQSNPSYGILDQIWSPCSDQSGRLPVVLVVIGGSR